jgi:hypothetical protein
VLRCDPAETEPDFAAAYRWMSEQYAERIGGPVVPLLWAWARIPRRELLRLSGWTTGSVLVTLDVPRDRVLLSDFDDWHAVINLWELQPRDVDDAELDRRIEAFWVEREALGATGRDIGLWPADLRERVVASWEALVFDIGPPPRVVQAVVDRFEASEVVDAVVIGRVTRGIEVSHASQPSQESGGLTDAPPLNR